MANTGIKLSNTLKLLIKKYVPVISGKQVLYLLTKSNPGTNTGKQA